jgi:hypothetical protein
MMNPNLQMQGMFFTMFGGAEKFDCWLTQMSETLANINDPQVQPIKLDEKMFPPMIQGLMYKPHEVIDTFLELLERSNAWEYQIKTNRTSAQVIDVLSGHIIEEGNAVELTEKYKGA